MMKRAGRSDVFVPQLLALIAGVLTVSLTTSSARQATQFAAVQKDLFAAGGAFVNAWADYDGDGDLDLFVGFDGTPNRLYRNDKGVFADAAMATGIGDARPTRAAAWGDADADGDPDLLVGFTPGAGSVLRFYRNAKGVFTDDTDAAGLSVATGAVRQLVWVDVDGDRDLDLFVGFRDRPNAFFRNDGGRFVDVAAELGLADPRKTVGAVWFDYDEDGDLDLIVGNMDGDANGLFAQDRGRFSDVGAAAGVAWGGREPENKANGTVRPCVADVDNDGHLDLFFANYGKNGLFINRGKGKFDNVSPLWRIDIDSRYDSCALADMDNDGDLDLYVNGTVTGGQNYRDYLFRNTGAAFEDVTPAEIGSPNGDHGVEWADYDLDGNIDLALTGTQKDGMHWLLRNIQPPSKTAWSLNVRVLDEQGRATLPGAELLVTAGSSKRVLGRRLVDAGSGYNAQNDAAVHIGVPDASAIAITLRVNRPGGPVNVSFPPLERTRWNGRVFEARLPASPPPRKN